MDGRSAVQRGSARVVAEGAVCEMSVYLSRPFGVIANVVNGPQNVLADAGHGDRGLNRRRVAQRWMCRGVGAAPQASRVEDES